MSKLLSPLKAALNELLWMLGTLLAQSFVFLAWILDHTTSAVSALYTHRERQPSGLAFGEND
ncbi:MAG: hypothetical protein AMJ66_10560 [Betaproteobacteria bacterium SG8_40]|nr:MAG: hypothetical protein AMJ66_10560 [Betaproteobacteria bacterium SG8_40]